jgi:hypothetical protein
MALLTWLAGNARPESAASIEKAKSKPAMAVTFHSQ